MWYFNSALASATFRKFREYCFPPEIDFQHQLKKWANFVRLKALIYLSEIEKVKIWNEFQEGMTLYSQINLHTLLEWWQLGDA